MGLTALPNAAPLTFDARSVVSHQNATIYGISAILYGISAIQAAWLWDRRELGVSLVCLLKYSVLFVGLYEGELAMSIPVLILFVVFFVVVCPVFLYWFSRYLNDPRTERPSFIGFPQDGIPQDGRTDHAQTQASPHLDGTQERR